jgi:hypothetical protein
MGLAAAGTASLQAAYAPDLGPLSANKIWNVSATLRGFYDDNYFTSNTDTRSSYGFEISPQLMLAVPLQQTELGLRNTYSMTYYQDRNSEGQSPIDQSDQLDLWVDHAFTERWHAKVLDTFVVGQEPQLLNPNAAPGSLPFRVSGDNIANNGTVTLNTDWTRLFSTSLNYHNSFYDYRNSGETVADLLAFYGGVPGASGPSLSGLLDRIEQTVWLDLQWHLSPETIGLFGSQVEFVNYTGSEPIAFSPVLPGNIYYSNNRDNRQYTGYVGVQHGFLPNLSVLAKAGVTYTDPYNDPLGSGSFSPYGVLSIIYTYLPGSYVQLGLNESQNATDVVTPDPTTGKITQYQQSTYVYGSINHLITPKLLGTLIGSWQYSTFKGGAFNNHPDSFYSLGLNFSYTFTPHLSADAGYNFDDLESDISGRGYTRNRVYIGVTAAY